MLLQTYSPRTNMLLQTYSLPSLVDSVEEKPAEEIYEDDPDHELDCPSRIHSKLHHTFIVCIPSPPPPPPP